MQWLSGGQGIQSPDDRQHKLPEQGTALPARLAHQGAYRFFEPFNGSQVVRGISPLTTGSTGCQGQSTASPSALAPSRGSDSMPCNDLQQVREVSPLAAGSTSCQRQSTALPCYTRLLRGTQVQHSYTRAAIRGLTEWKHLDSLSLHASTKGGTTPSLHIGS